MRFLKKDYRLACGGFRFPRFMHGAYDYIVVGSGFGGSVAALRLAEKGYRVAVLEQGLRYRTEDFPRTNWNLRKFLWRPSLGLYGIQAMTLLKDVFVLHGAGVGGGSLVYANNLLVPPEEVLNDPAWGQPNMAAVLQPYYQRARRMLGATPSPIITPADELLQECARDIGRGDTFHVNDVGVFFGEEGVTVPDPYFGGTGPPRAGCTRCGGCMVGCRYNAKNTLDKNYLYLAEQLGVGVIPNTRVIDVKPIGTSGYSLLTERVTGFFHPRKVYRAKGVFFCAGVLGTVKLLLKCKHNGSLPDLSPQLGNVVRTNSEALVGAKAGGKSVDFSQGIAITSGVYPDDNTHIETVRYGKGQDAMSFLATLLVGGGKAWPRPVRFLGTVLRHPLRFLKSLNPFGWAERTIILLVMQKVDNYLRLEYKPRWWRLGKRSLNSFHHTEKKVPSYIPVANDFARRLAEKTGGEAFSVLPEVLLDTCTTAHILGGCIMGADPERGVIDFRGKIHGCNNLYVADGSVIPVNLAVNPSLTITALAEYILEQVPPKDKL